MSHCHQSKEFKHIHFNQNIGNYTAENVYPLFAQTELVDLAKRVGKQLRAQPRSVCDLLLWK